MNRCGCVPIKVYLQKQAVAGLAHGALFADFRAGAMRHVNMRHQLKSGDQLKSGVGRVQTQDELKHPGTGR